jgi:protoheme IX farnesyltransferase
VSPRDALTLVRPKIAVLVLVTTWVGALAAGVAAPGSVIFHACVGTLLVTAAASALNQLLERDTDALMERTRDRPLPAGRTTPGRVLAFSLALGVAGEVELWLGANAISALIGLATLVLYVAIYTPLKRRTTLNTLVGAIAGAAPPVIGWAAVRGTVADQGALSLFAIVFLWQFPHFLAIAWLFRDDYARAGLQMLPAIELGRGITRRAVPHYALALVPASLVPTIAGIAGTTYFVGALALSVAFLGFALGFSVWESRAGARRLLLASIAYLPILFGLMVLDRASA